MPGTKLEPRQFHLRMSDEMAQKASARACAMGIGINEWLTRAVLHALAHAEQEGEPKPLRLPWSVLL